MRRTLAVSVMLLVSCSDSKSPTVPAAGRAVADLRLNTQKAGTFNCSEGLFFAANVVNRTSSAVQVDGVTLAFSKVSGPWCSSHAAPISPAVAVTVPPGASAEIRRVDLAGDLCAAPHGDPGCEWLAKATLSTSAGTLTDEISFRTTDPTGPVLAPPPPNVPGNRPPTVSISGGGSCHPSRSRPCTVEFVAEARDRDGDAVTLIWSGCASGGNARATCVVRSPTEHTARVDASDGRGGFARAFATAEGTNLPPRVRFGIPRPPDRAPSNTLYILTGGQPEDPDLDEDSNALCRTAMVTASGPCRAALGACGGVGDAFDVDVGTLNGPGTCTVQAEVRDSWGAVGTDRLEFAVSPP